MSVDKIGEREEIDLIHDWLGLEGDKTAYTAPVEPTYEEKVVYIDKHIGLDKTTLMGEDLLTLVSLVNAFVMKAKVKNPNVGPREILKALLGEPTGKGEEFIRERVALVCEIFLVPQSKFRTFGLNSKEEVITEIKRILDSWIPF